MTSIDLFAPFPGTELEILLDGDLGSDDGLDDAGDGFVEIADKPPCP